MRQISHLSQRDLNRRPYALVTASGFAKLDAEANMPLIV
jgi:hypothetical protein